MAHIRRAGKEYTASLADLAFGKMDEASALITMRLKQPTHRRCAWVLVYEVTLGHRLS